MKYKTRIFPEGDGYVGQAIVDDQVVYTTNVVRDGVMVARELSTYISSVGNASPVTKTSPSSRKQIASSVNYNETPSSEPIKSTGPFYQPSTKQDVPANVVNPPPRKCCGRG